MEHAAFVADQLTGKKFQNLHEILLREDVEF